jgi:hypothetical protein
MRVQAPVIAIALLSVGATVGLISLLHRLGWGKPVHGLQPELPLRPTEVVQVAVLNACGQPGLARRTMEFLRRYGVDVVEIGTLDSLVPHSALYEHLGELRAAHALARLLGLPEHAVHHRSDSTLYRHCTIVIGADYHQLRPFAAR